MSKLRQNKFYWQKILGTMTIALGATALGAISGLEPAAMAADLIPGNFNLKLAQVGVRSRINAPTSINITPPPGSHIPLPESNYHRRYEDRYEDRGYYPDQRGSVSDDYPEDYRRDRDRGWNYEGRSRRENCDRSNRDYTRGRSDRSQNRRVIIISPANQSRYENSGSYMRVTSW
jgi:hypothetical protein